MYRMRERWTDERFDDFAKHVDQRFHAVNQRFDAVDRRFDAVDRRFEDVNQRLDHVDIDIRELRKDLNTKFDGLQRTLLLGNLGIIAALVGVIATQL
jgi:DNA anti-recombination protein RmuC